MAPRGLASTHLSGLTVICCVRQEKRNPRHSAVYTNVITFLSCTRRISKVGQNLYPWLQLEMHPHAHFGGTAVNEPGGYHIF